MTHKKVDFFCVGAAKAGSTWLANALAQHPDIFIPKRKELCYFNAEYAVDPTVPNPNFTRSLQWYHSFFTSASVNQLWGDMTPVYLSSEIASSKIRSYNPSARIIIILREPLQRALSEFHFMKQRGHIGNIPFEDAVRLKKEIIQRSSYFEQVSRYIESFRDVKVILFEQMLCNRESFLFEIEDFLGVPHFIPDNITEKANPTGVPYFPLVNSIAYQVKTFMRKRGLTGLIRFLERTGVASLGNEMVKRNNKPFVTKPSVPHLSNDLRRLFKDEAEKMQGIIGDKYGLWNA